MVCFTISMLLVSPVLAQINIGGIVSAGENAGESIASAAQDTSSELGALATAAQSALGNVAPSSSAQSSADSTSNTPSSLASTSAQPTSLSSDVSSSASSISTSTPASSQASSTPTSDSTSLSSTSSPSSTLSSTLSTTSSVPSPQPTLAQSNISTGNSTDASKSKQHKTDTLLEIILPTVLSGLTLLLLLAAILWFCARRRRYRRNRRSGMEHLYRVDTAASHDRADSEMEQHAGSSLLHGNQLVSPTAAGVDAHDTAYEPHHHPIPVPPEQSMQRGMPRFGGGNESPSRWTIPTSRFSSFTTTNRASETTHSNSGHPSHIEPITGQDGRHSYQPVPTNGATADLGAGTGPDRTSSNGGSLRSSHSRPGRIHTPPLQAMFPWFGKGKADGGPSVPRRSSKRKSSGNIHYPSYEEAGGFTFPFNHDRGRYEATASGQPETNRFSIPRKPVAYASQYPV